MKTFLETPAIGGSRKASLPYPCRMGTGLGRTAVFLGGIRIDRLHLAAMAPVVAEVEDVLERHPDVEVSEASVTPVLSNHLRLEIAAAEHVPLAVTELELVKV